MLDALVDLGSIKVTGKKPNLSLTLSSSFTISPPPLWPITLTADELSRASSTGNIWVSKAGSCQIEVLTLVNDEPPDFAFEPSTVAAIVSLASECPVSRSLVTTRDPLNILDMETHRTRTSCGPHFQRSTKPGSVPVVILSSPSRSII